MRHLSAYLLLVLGGNEKPTVGTDWNMFNRVGCWHQERPWDCWRWGWGWEDWEADRWSGGKERRGADQGGTWEACLHSYWRCCPRCWCCSCCCWGEEGGGEEGRGGRRGGHWYVWRWSLRWWWRWLVNNEGIGFGIIYINVFVFVTNRDTVNLEICESRWLFPSSPWTVRTTLKAHYSLTFANYSTFMYYSPSEWGRETIILCLPCILFWFYYSSCLKVMNCRSQVSCAFWHSSTETYIRPLSLDTFDPLVHDGKWVLFFKDVEVFL